MKRIAQIATTCALLCAGALSATAGGQRTQPRGISRDKVLTTLYAQIGEMSRAVRTFSAPAEQAFYNAADIALSSIRAGARWTRKDRTLGGLRVTRFRRGDETVTVARLAADKIDQSNTMAIRVRHAPEAWRQGHAESVAVSKDAAFTAFSRVRYPKSTVQAERWKRTEQTAEGPGLLHGTGQFEEVNLDANGRRVWSNEQSYDYRPQGAPETTGSR